MDFDGNLMLDGGVARVGMVSVDTMRVTGSRLDALLDEAQDLFLADAVGRPDVPCCAYVLDGSGSFSSVHFPTPHADDDREAIAAILAFRLRNSASAMCAIAMPMPPTGDGLARLAALDGHLIEDDRIVTRRRVMRVLRSDRAVWGFVPVDHDEAPSPHPG